MQFDSNSFTKKWAKLVIYFLKRGKELLVGFQKNQFICPT